jgi:hypothetical protein
MANRRQNTRYTRERLKSQVVTGLCHFCPIVQLPPWANSGKFLDQGLPLLLLLPEDETMLSGYALIMYNMDRNVSGFHAIECFF